MKFIKDLFRKKSHGISTEDVLMLNSIADSISSKIDLEKCLKQLLEHIKTSPDNAYLHQLIATAYFKEGMSESAEMHLNTSIVKGIKDGGYSLLIRAYNNMFDGYCAYEAVESLRTLVNERESYVESSTGESQTGFFLKLNEYGFQSYYIDMRSKEMMAKILYSLAITSYDFEEKHEAVRYLSEALKLQPDNLVFKQKMTEFKNDMASIEDKS